MIFFNSEVNNNYGEITMSNITPVRLTPIIAAYFSVAVKDLKTAEERHLKIESIVRESLALVSAEIDEIKANLSEVLGPNPLIKFELFKMYVKEAIYDKYYEKGSESVQKAFQSNVHKMIADSYKANGLCGTGLNYRYFVEHGIRLYIAKNYSLNKQKAIWNEAKEVAKYYNTTHRIIIEA